MEKVGYIHIWKDSKGKRHEDIYYLYDFRVRNNDKKDADWPTFNWYLYDYRVKPE